MKIPVDKHARIALAQRFVVARAHAATKALWYAKQILLDAERIAAAPAKAAAAKKRKAERDAADAQYRLEAAEREQQAIAVAAQRALEEAEQSRQRKLLLEARNNADEALRKQEAIVKAERNAQWLRTLAENLPAVPPSNASADAIKFQILSINQTNMTADIVIGRDDGMRTCVIPGIGFFAAGYLNQVHVEILKKMMQHSGLRLVETVMR